ncbi:ABC transporter permease [Dyadobacter sp. CY312]|uniref:ABC transporter permease n=1 Tax=Dyadobacter sp. CY312 TaxID=2907303 RepID=UPI001F28A163|nr:FtsX-like permease family protein [Dyadobacter sp. CY312]MCE7039901.1 ABC transporter permease [Dyadobacter sp. CY312]
MLRHLFKLIWNKKGSHSLLIIEIWASFMVLFGVLSLIVYNVSNYVQPIGFEYERVWNLQLSNNQDTVGVSDKMHRIVQQIKSNKEVESLSRMSSNSPFSANQMMNGVTYKKVSISPEFFYTDENFSKTLGLPVVAGKWFTESDRVSKFTPIVINSKLKEVLFANENPLGKVIKVDDKKSFKVVGLVDKFKSKGEFASDSPALFEMLSKDDTWSTNVLIKTKAGVDANFEAKLVKEVAATLPGWGIEVSYLTEQRKNRHNLTLVPVTIFLIVSGFLLTNVALGLFGILNLNIAKRKNEIGLRRAMGATESGVTTQFLGEIWVLAALSVLIGLLFAIQFPIIHVFDMKANIYITAIVIAIVLIFIIVTLCAWWPSRQASRIHPAIALHEE